MSQEPPSRHKTETPRPVASVQRKAEVPKMPKRVETPVPRPAQIVTGSVARPENPLSERRADDSLYTTTRVNMRATANRAAPIVTTLSAGAAVKPILREGKWQLVSVHGRKGWILGDYLRRPGPDAPRPSLSVPGTAGAKLSFGSEQKGSSRPQSDHPSSLMLKAKALFGGERKPLRAPQEGNCQCPYDLMIDGSPCGERSAYSQRSRRQVQCYM
ncbi:MAG: SH3 domain-containing protein [Pseudaminobacter sp.]